MFLYIIEPAVTPRLWFPFLDIFVFFNLYIIFIIPLVVLLYIYIYEFDILRTARCATRAHLGMHSNLCRVRELSITVGTAGFWP